jgi:hypothetical protein
MAHANLIASSQAFVADVLHAANTVNAVAGPLQAQLTQLQQGQQQMQQQMQQHNQQMQQHNQQMQQIQALLQTLVFQYTRISLVIFHWLGVMLLCIRVCLGFREQVSTE